MWTIKCRLTDERALWFLGTVIRLMGHELEILVVEYLGHGETYRERKKNTLRKRGKEEEKERWRRRGRENSGKYNNLSKDYLKNSR